MKKKQVSPLELIDATEEQTAEIEPAGNALPINCFDRARYPAKRIM